MDVLFAETNVNTVKLLAEAGFEWLFQTNRFVVVLFMRTAVHNVMKSSNAPRQLMRQVSNVSFTEMKGADRCCGSAGIWKLST